VCNFKNIVQYLHVTALFPYQYTLFILELVCRVWNSLFSKLRMISMDNNIIHSLDIHLLLILCLYLRHHSSTHAMSLWRYFLWQNATIIIQKGDDLHGPSYLLIWSVKYIHWLLFCSRVNLFLSLMAALVKLPHNAGETLSVLSMPDLKIIFLNNIISLTGCREGNLIISFHNTKCCQYSVS